MNPSKLAIAVVVVACASVGCVVDLVGTGTNPAPTNKSKETEPSGSGEGSVASPTPTPTPPTASGAPLEIEALFLPPTIDTVTPDSLSGVWAGTASDADERIKFGATDITLAKKCKADGRIVFVTVKVRTTDVDAKITILEHKTAKLTNEADYYYACNFIIDLEVGEWTNCKTPNNGYDCFSISGTKLHGLTPKMSSDIESTSWLKLSD